MNMKLPIMYQIRVVRENVASRHNFTCLHLIVHKLCDNSGIEDILICPSEPLKLCLFLQQIQCRMFDQNDRFMYSMSYQLAGSIPKLVVRALEARHSIQSFLLPSAYNQFPWSLSPSYGLIGSEKSLASFLFWTSDL